MCRYVADMPGPVPNAAGCAAVLAAEGALSFGLPAINSEIPPQRYGVQYRVQAIPYAGTLGGLAEALRGDVTHARGAQAVGPAIPMSTAHGVPGMAARFEESNGAGFVAAFLDRDVRVDVLVSRTDQGMITNADKILDSVRTLRFEGRR